MLCTHRFGERGTRCVFWLIPGNKFVKSFGKETTHYLLCARRGGKGKERVNDVKLRWAKKLINYFRKIAENIEQSKCEKNNENLPVQQTEYRIRKHGFLK